MTGELYWGPQLARYGYSKELLGAAKNMSYFPPPNGEKWRIPLLSELLDLRDERSAVPGFEPAAIESMINEIFCN